MKSHCLSHGGFQGCRARLPQRSVLPGSILPTASTVWKAVPTAVRIALLAAASVFVAWAVMSVSRNSAILAAEPVSSQRDQDGRYESPSPAAVTRMVLVVDSEARPLPPDREPASAVGAPASSLTLRALSGTNAPSGTRSEGPPLATPRSANAERKPTAILPRTLAGEPSASRLSAYLAEPPRTRSPMLPSPTTEELRTPRAEKKPAAEFDLDSRPIGSVTTNIRCQQGELPQDVAQAKLKALRGRPYDQLTDREWEALCYLWEAPALRHQPLYFEEVNLERYGYYWPGLKPIQPVLSCGQFFGTLPLLPYKMWCEPSRECDYTLGQYRPGSAAPYEIQLPCWRPGAAAAEVGTVAGLILLIP